MVRAPGTISSTADEASSLAIGSSQAVAKQPKANVCGWTSSTPVIQTTKPPVCSPSKFPVRSSTPRHNTSTKPREVPCSLVSWPCWTDWTRCTACPKAVGGPRPSEFASFLTLRGADFSTGTVLCSKGATDPATVRAGASFTSNGSTSETSSTPSTTRRHSVASESKPTRVYRAFGCASSMTAAPRTTPATGSCWSTRMRALQPRDPTPLRRTASTTAPTASLAKEEALARSDVEARSASSASSTAEGPVASPLASATLAPSV